MNELIKELQKQALVPGHWSDNGERFIGAHIDMEKFAELIVKECIDCLKPLSRNHSMVGAAQDTIKEHFGVEE